MPERQRLTLSLPECAEDAFCDPITEHTDDGHIRDRCLQCGKVGPWIVVLVSLTEGGQ